MSYGRPSQAFSKTFSETTSIADLGTVDKCPQEDILDVLERENHNMRKQISKVLKDIKLKQDPKQNFKLYQKLKSSKELLVELIKAVQKNNFLPLTTLYERSDVEDLFFQSESLTPYLTTTMALFDRDCNKFVSLSNSGSQSARLNRLSTVHKSRHVKVSTNQSSLVTQHRKQFIMPQSLRDN